MKKHDMTQKIVVVTGAASGIGAAISRRFARQGAALGLLDMDEKGIAAMAAEFNNTGIKTVPIGCDVSKESDCISAVSKIIDHFSGIDILVNNAGITQRSAFVDTRSSVFRKVMAVNFFGALHCTQAAMDSLIARKGMIIVMESIAGLAPLLGRTGYCASKHALHGLFTSLRAEIRNSGVHVMIVCPGFVETNLQTRALGGNGRVTSHPQSRVGKQTSPQQVADAVYQGVIKKKHLIVLSPVGKLTYWLNRIAPLLYERLMTRKLKDEIFP
ncbi:MAG: SDR family oxidoreductase [Desulfobacterales bacterium]|nr:SDR family oxidoreductase [Desulfobacterales bacterium]